MTETETPRKRRMVRRGPPGVRCPDCGKLAGNADEGEIESYQAEVDGSEGSVSVTINAELYMNTACCGSRFKMYTLEGTNEIDHQCPKVEERDTAEQKYADHVEAGKCACTTDQPDCDDGVALRDEAKELADSVENDGNDWTIDDDGESDASAYERSQATDRHGKPITSYRFRKSYRGITTTVSVQHGLCEETETVTFDEGDIEAGAGDFEPTN